MDSTIANMLVTLSIEQIATVQEYIRKLNAHNQNLDEEKASQKD